jgi:hypothetical protein
MRELLAIYQAIERLHALLAKELCDCGSRYPMEPATHSNDCPYKRAAFGDADGQ